MKKFNASRPMLYIVAGAILAALLWPIPKGRLDFSACPENADCAGEYRSAPRIISIANHQVYEYPQCKPQLDGREICETLQGDSVSAGIVSLLLGGLVGYGGYWIIGKNMKTKKSNR